jgi:hypothetical protein
MSLVTTQPLTITDGTTVHTFTFHHQDTSQPLAAEYRSDQETADNQERFKVAYATAKNGRRRGLAQVVFHVNVGTTELPEYQPCIFNVTYSVPKGVEDSDVAKGLTLSANLLDEPGFIAGFAGEFIE